MAVEFKSGDGSDLATVDPQSKAIRVTHYSSDGVEGSHDLPEAIVVNDTSSANEDIIPSTNVELYKFVSLQVNGNWNAVVTVQGSNDNSNFFDVVFQDVSTIDAPYNTTLSGNSLIKIPVFFKHLRVRVTSYTSGIVQGTAFGYSEANSFNSVSQVGSVALNAETTKVIGTVNVSADQAHIVGQITAADNLVGVPDNTGTLVQGNPSVNSYIQLDTNPQHSAWAVEITGDLDGATFYFEGTIHTEANEDANWIAINGRSTGVLDTDLSASTIGAGFFRGNLAGMKHFRVRATGGNSNINAEIHVRVGYGSGAVFLNASIPAGDNIIGTVRVAPSFSEGPTFYKFISSSGVNSTNLTTSVTNLNILNVVNTAATMRYFKLYNKASAPIVGTDIPLIVIALSPNSASNFTLPPLAGIDFSIGLSFAAMTEPQDSSSAPLTVSGEIVAMIAYND